MAAATADFLSSLSRFSSPCSCAFCSLYLRACSLRAARSLTTSELSGSSSASGPCFFALARAIAAATADLLSLASDLLFTRASASATFCFSPSDFAAGLRL